MRILNRNRPPDSGKAKGKKKGKEGKKEAGKKDGKKRSAGKKGGAKDNETISTASATSGFSSDTNLALEDIMKDNLDLMREVIMRIREDEDYAKTIYADCPRLQHLLDRNPDLRPIFEDPNLVRINFESVYRKCGGVLPEDKKPWYLRILAAIVNHPLFKVFRCLLFIKKLYSCIFNGGFLLIRNMMVSIFKPNIDNPDELVEDAADAVGNPDNLACREALCRAAEHMEEPDVRDQMEILLEGDPDDLDEIIENDPELNALRHSSPLCSELMSDPATLRILVDPDNLRALSECADLIEQDFADPNWSAPDVESIPYDDPAYVEADAAPVDSAVPDEAAADLVDPDAEVDGDGDQVDGNDENDGDNDGDNDDDGGFMDEFERGDEAEAKGANKKQQQKKQNNKNQKEGGGGAVGFLSTIGTGLVDYIAAETVGMTASELMGGDDDLAGLEELDEKAEEVADEAADAADDAANNADQMAMAVNTVAGLAEDEDLVENVEGTMDQVEDAHDEEGEEDNTAAAGTAAETIAAAGAMGAEGVMAVPGEDGKKDRGLDGEDPTVKEDDEMEEANEEKKKPKSRFGRIGSAIGGGFAAIGAATKEFAVTAILGEDLAEEVIEKMEEESNNSDDESKNSKKDDDKENDTGNVKDRSQGSLLSMSSWSGSGFFGRQN